jgi:predicted membrane-bound spermidine synthase
MSVPPALGRISGGLVALLAGFVALSWEIVWYRAYAVALMGRPQAFAVVLGGYLIGLGAGALAAARWCAPPGEAGRLRWQLAWALAGAGVCGFLLVPLFAWWVTIARIWSVSLLLVSGAAFVLGSVFPLIVQASVRADHAVGRGAASVYVANIAGSALGAVVTGFYLMDVLTMRWICGLLGGGSIVMGAAVLLAPGTDARARHRERAGAVALLGVAAAVALVTPWCFEGLWERLFFRTEVAASPRFTEVVENRAGVIGVTAEGAVYGGGVYDGSYNTDLRARAQNQIHRAYAIGAFHPAPRRVLVIGLGSGSWARVIADHPSVEALTVVEINRGYVELLARHSQVADLRSHPKVTLEIADGRRWLARHPEETFDLVVANTVYHWRANASSLLSVEFLQLVRRHLRPGGLYLYNTTSDGRAFKTGVTVFPHAWRLAHLLVAGDAPFAPDFERLADQLRAYRLRGLPVLDATRPEDLGVIDGILDDMRRELEGRDGVLTRTAHLAPITDDNMGTEWQLPPRYRLD